MKSLDVYRYSCFYNWRLSLFLVFLCFQVNLLNINISTPISNGSYLPCGSFSNVSYTFVVSGGKESDMTWQTAKYFQTSWVFNVLGVPFENNTQYDLKYIYIYRDSFNKYNLFCIQCDYCYLGTNYYILGFPGGTSGKEPACQCRRHRRRGFSPEAGKIPWRRAWQLTPVFLPGEWQTGVWQATVHKSVNQGTWPKRLSTYTHAHYVLFWISYMIFVVLSFTSMRPIFLSFYLPGFLQFFFLYT